MLHCILWETLCPIIFCASARPTLVPLGCERHLAIAIKATVKCTCYKLHCQNQYFSVNEKNKRPRTHKHHLFVNAKARMSRWTPEAPCLCFTLSKGSVIEAQDAVLRPALTFSNCLFPSYCTPCHSRHYLMGVDKGGEIISLSIPMFSWILSLHLLCTGIDNHLSLQKKFKLALWNSLQYWMFLKEPFLLLQTSKLASLLNGQFKPCAHYLYIRNEVQSPQTQVTKRNLFLYYKHASEKWHSFLPS